MHIVINVSSFFFFSFSFLSHRALHSTLCNFIHSFFSLSHSLVSASASLFRFRILLLLVQFIHTAIHWLASKMCVPIYAGKVHVLKCQHHNARCLLLKVFVLRICCHCFFFVSYVDSSRFLIDIVIVTAFVLKTKKKDTEKR